jgi:hypothetical protein
MKILGANFLHVSAPSRFGFVIIIRSDFSGLIENVQYVPISNCKVKFTFVLLSTTIKLY